MSEALTADRPMTSAPRRDGAFPSAEQAWFWTMSALAARHTGTNASGSGKTPRPCDPDDVIRALDQLYRQRRIDLVHARILRIWGERGAAPSARHPGQASDARIWREAMDRLDAKLRARGIVA